MTFMDEDSKWRLLSVVILLCGACQSTPPGGNPNPNPDSEPATLTIGASTVSIGNQILNGPIPGCADAAELINQSVALPEMPITLDAQGIFDRIDTSASAASYTFSVRPVNPFNCESTRLPSLPAITIDFGFTYSGDFSRVDPICINASVLNLSSFSVTGTPIDALIRPFFRGVLWGEIDKQIADRMHGLLNGGARPSGAAVRCSNWVDQSTL